MRKPCTFWHERDVLLMVEMSWFQHRSYSFVSLRFVLWSRCMFQQESGHGIMWAYNNKDATVGFILILIVKTDLNERSLWSKCKACLDSSPRRQYSLNYCCGIWVLGCVTPSLCDKRPCEQQQWLMRTPLCDVLLSVNGCPNDWSPIDQQDLSSTADTPVPQYGFTHCFLPVSEVPLCSQLSDRKCFTLPDFEQSAQTNCASFIFLPLSISQGLLLYRKYSIFFKDSARRKHDEERKLRSK